jgi:hypothetical protein
MLPLHVHAEKLLARLTYLLPSSYIVIGVTIHPACGEGVHCSGGENGFSVLLAL